MLISSACYDTWQTQHSEVSVLNSLDQEFIRKGQLLNVNLPKNVRISCEVLKQLLKRTSIFDRRKIIKFVALDCLIFEKKKCFCLEVPSQGIKIFLSQIVNN